MPEGMTPWGDYLDRQRGHELADLRLHWDGAYQFSWQDGKYRAIRADNGNMLEADDAVDLNELIRLDYCEHPVPRTDIW